uniref:Uncharacterized protein n=1 Tax=Anguilla anguilla TaxID=7936 RepID=A0A0E9VGH8_ANGAN
MQRRELARYFAW